MTRPSRDDQWSRYGISHNFDSSLKDSKGRSPFDLTVSHLSKVRQRLPFSDFVAPIEFCLGAFSDANTTWVPFSFPRKKFTLS
jgi:hypothetical protein